MDWAVTEMENARVFFSNSIRLESQGHMEFLVQNWDRAEKKPLGSMQLMEYFGSSVEDKSACLQNLENSSSQVFGHVLDGQVTLYQGKGTRYSSTHDLTRIPRCKGNGGCCQGKGKWRMLSRERDKMQWRTWSNMNTQVQDHPLLLFVIMTSLDFLPFRFPSMFKIGRIRIFYSFEAITTNLWGTIL